MKVSRFAFMHRYADNYLGFQFDSFLLEWLEDERERRHWMDMPAGILGVMFEEAA